MEPWEREREHLAVARAAAAELAAVGCRLTAALAWGWPVRLVPERPQLSLPKNRRITGDRSAAAEIRRANLRPHEIEGWVTSRERTLSDCLRWAPFGDALAVADSALRDGFLKGDLDRIAREARGPGAARLKQVALRADARAANPFESALRAIALSVPGLCVVPQVDIAEPDFLGRPDLVDERLRMIIEADSFEGHATRDGLVRDARRYNGFVVGGWLVLRFTWDDVILRPKVVRAVLVAAVKERTYWVQSRGSAA